MNRHQILLATLVALSFGISGAVAGKRTLQLSDIQTLAGKELSSVPFRGLRSWRSVDDQHLMIEAAPRKTYLLGLYGPCTELRYEIQIGIKQQGSMLSAGFDSVLFPNSFTRTAQIPCRIKSIQQVDTAALRSLEKRIRTE